MIHPEKDESENGENEIILKGSTSTIKFLGNISISLIDVNTIFVGY